MYINLDYFEKNTDMHSVIQTKYNDINFQDNKIKKQKNIDNELSIYYYY